MARPQRSLVVLGSVLLVYILAGISISFSVPDISPQGAAQAPETSEVVVWADAPEILPGLATGL